MKTKTNIVMQAVLTGDIVNSTRLSAAKQKTLTEQLTNIFTSHGYQIDFYRGDSFQAYVKDPEQALQLALLSRTAAIRLSKNEGEVLSDVRISIGIGEVSTPVSSLRTAKGEAFLLSGRTFDEMIKNDQRLAISCANVIANEGMQVISDYVNAIFNSMTGKQAEVIFELLNGEMQKEVAKKIKKTRSTIHQRITSGRWAEIEKLLSRYNNIYKLII